jgi:hypothetical protein
MFLIKVSHFIWGITGYHFSFRQPLLSEILLSDTSYVILRCFNPLNTQLNPICHLLALLGAHHIFHVSRVKRPLLVTVIWWFTQVCNSVNEMIFWNNFNDNGYKSVICFTYLPSLPIWNTWMADRQSCLGQLGWCGIGLYYNSGKYSWIQNISSHCDYSGWWVNG